MLTPKDYAWHAVDTENALTQLRSNISTGLTQNEAQRRLSIYGSNSLPESAAKSIFQIFLLQFKSPLIYLLFIAAAASAFLGEAQDAFVILVVVLINSLVGAFQEGKAERTLSALAKLSQVNARVLRDNKEYNINASELVPGDIILLNAGDAVPADARIIEAYTLETNEAPLTGESNPVAKADFILPENSPTADRTNMLFSGTYVLSGRAVAVVVKTGIQTEIGQIASITKAVKDTQTPLEKRVTRFSHQLVVVALFLFAAIVGIGWLKKISLIEIVMVGISQVVSMVPEGLPIAITVALAIGVQKMAARRAIIRKLAAVEALGSITVICTDKTGTLTRNEMTVTEIQLPNNRKIDVSGIGYSSEGGFSENSNQIFPDLLNEADDVGRLLLISALCNDASVHHNDSNHAVVGDPTEAALIIAAEKAGFDQQKLETLFPRQHEIPFDAKSKMMLTEHLNTNGQRFLALKGALESLLPLCSDYLNNGEVNKLSTEHKKKFQLQAHEMADRALRVLAVAYITDYSIKNNGTENIPQQAVFVGLIGQIDPARPEVKEALEECFSAGIRPIMITGDHKATGLAVAKTIGLADSDDLAIDGNELNSLSEANLKKKIHQISVFARVQPAQKLQIVKVLQAQQQVVAMTGDGVNDAPALRQADVGIAMGITGTEVAKEASEIVITDDNFATIVSTIAEGRLVYQNIKKVILLLFSTSLAEIFILFGAMLVGFPPPFAAVQILWNNLVTEGVITINLILDPKEGNEMKRPPTSTDEPLITKLILTRMFFMAPTMLIITLGWFIFRLKQDVSFETTRTETFCIIAFCEWYNVLNCRSETKSAFSLDILRNKWLIGGLTLGVILQMLVVFWQPLSSVFRTVSIDYSILPIMALAASPMLLIEELRKFFVRRKAAALANI